MTTHPSHPKPGTPTTRCPDPNHHYQVRSEAAGLRRALIDLLPAEREAVLRTEGQGAERPYEEGVALEEEQPVHAASLDLSRRQSMAALEDEEEPEWLHMASLELSRRQSMDLPRSQSPGPGHDTVAWWSGTPTIAPALSGVDGYPNHDPHRHPTHQQAAAAAEIAKPGARHCSLGDIATSWWLGLPFVTVSQPAAADMPPLPLADTQWRAQADAASTIPPPCSGLVGEEVARGEVEVVGRRGAEQATSQLAEGLVGEQVDKWAEQAPRKSVPWWRFRGLSRLTAEWVDSWLPAECSAEQCEV